MSNWQTSVDNEILKGHIGILDDHAARIVQEADRQGVSLPRSALANTPAVSRLRIV
jgi:hypothetical protein